MTTLADSIKRLRELDALKQKSEQPISETFKPIHQARAELDYHNSCHQSMPEAIRTINQLVELVAEVRDAGKELTRFYDGKGSYNGDVEKLNQRRTLTKADALLTKLGEV